MCGLLLQVSGVLLFMFGMFGFVFGLVEVFISLLVCSSDSDDMDFSVKYLENLTEVPRFDMLIMCLSSTDTSGMFL